jgi:hypothetical protein
VFSKVFLQKSVSHFPSTHLVGARELQGKETVSADLRCVYG